MARFFADEDFDAEIGSALARLGHDLDGVVHRGLGNKGTTDDSVLALASGEKRILLTPQPAALCPAAPGRPESRRHRRLFAARRAGGNGGDH